MRRCLVPLWLWVGCSTSVAPPPDAGGYVDPNPIDLSDWQAAGLDPDGGTLDFLAELSKATLGEAADLDGDGRRELSVLTLADGTRVWNWDVDGRPGFRIEQLSGALTRYTYWYSNWAATRMVDEYRPGRRVTVIDDNLDFKLDRRRTQTPYDAGLVEVVEEVDGGAAWLEVQRYVAAQSVDQQTRRDALFGCDGNSNFAEELSTATAAVSFSNQAPVSCTPDQRKQLQQAFDCAKKSLDGCLARTNPTLRREVLAHLITGKLLIGCGNGCEGKLASTLAASGGSSARMNFNPGYAWEPQKLCALMLHELTHTAEVGFDSQHNAGLDRTYACSNYCGGCTNVGPYGASAPLTPPPSMNENCARCAETEAERRKCGTKVQKRSGGCVTNYALCHAGLGGNMSCETCGNLHTLDCLDGEVAPVRFDCCATCPSGYPTNDKPCPTGVPQTDTCTMKPPECP